MTRNSKVKVALAVGGVGLVLLMVAWAAIGTDNLVVGGVAATGAAAAMLEAARRARGQQVQEEVGDAQEHGRQAAAQILRERRDQLRAERLERERVESMTLQEKVDLANGQDGGES